MATSTRPAEPGSPLERVLLVEFAVTDRFHRAVLFPYLQGFLAHRGIAARWVRLGVMASTGWRHGAVLSPDEEALLAEAIGELQPDGIIFGHRPARSLVATLGLVSGHVRAAYLDTESHGVQAPPTDAMVVRLAPDDGSIPSFLGVDPPSDRAAWLLADTTPDFGYAPLGTLAGSTAPLPFVFVDEECTYNRPFSKNPFLASVSREDCLRPGGCAFCMRAGSAGSWGGDPMERLERSLTALAATIPDRSARLDVRLVGEVIMRRVDEVARRIVGLDLPPLKLLLDSRADTLVASAERLEAAIATVAPTSHALSLSLVGIESFSRTALQRLNKGTTPEGNIRAIETLYALEARHPDTFSFREHGGLSFVVFDPWTTPEDLAMTLAVVDLLGLEDLTGKLFSSRLRLYPGLPLAALARQEGLLVDEYHDTLLDTARRTFYEDELPWRSADPFMDQVQRLFLRIPDEPLTRDDPLGERMGALVAAWSREEPRAPLELARTILAVGLRARWREAPRVPSAEELLDEVAAVPPPDPAALANREERWVRHTDVEDGTLFGLVPLEAWLQVKPVLKQEPIAPEDVPAWEGDPRLPHKLLRARTKALATGGVAKRDDETGRDAPSREAERRPEASTKDPWEIFMGLDPAQVTRAKELAAVLDEERSHEVWTEATAEMGRLLGYPSCCAEAFANERPGIRDHYFWLHVSRRLATPGPVPWELNPAGELLVEYVPCGADCPASLTRARRLVEAIEATTPGATAAIEERLRHPHLLVHEVQGTFVELVPRSPVGERFRYSAGASRGNDAVIDVVRQGDEIVLEGHDVSILADGRLVGSLAGRAFVWWHERVFHDDLWRAMVSFQREVGGMTHGARGPGLTADVGAGTPAMRSLEALLTRLVDKHHGFGGFSIDGWRFPRPDEAHVTFAGPSSSMALTVRARQGTDRWMLEAGPFVIGHPRSSPLTDEEQRRGASLFATTVAAIYERRAQRRRQGG